MSRIFLLKIIDRRLKLIIRSVLLEFLAVPFDFEIGIEPDIEVEWDYDKYKNEGIDNQLEAAKDYLKEEIK